MKSLRLLFAVVSVLCACGGDRGPTGPEPTPTDCLKVRALPAAHPISPERLAERRAAALEASGVPVVIVGAGWEMGDAEGDASRQRSDFYWLTGLEHSERGWLVLAATDDGGHRCHRRGRR